MPQDKDLDVQSCRAGRMALLIVCVLPLATLPPDAKAVEPRQPVPLQAAGLPIEASPDATEPPGSLTTCLTPALLTDLVNPGRLVIRDTDRPDVERD